MKDLVLCGYFISEDDVEEAIYCNPHTGDLILNSSLSGNLLFGNVSVTNPVNMDGVDCSQLREYTGAIGTVMTGDYLLTFFRDFTMEYRKSTSPREVYMTSTYDLDADYEGNIF